MQELYLIRHGQAGLRTDYDQLSPLGTQQATLLAGWFASQDIHFDAVVSGALRRQQATAAPLGAPTIDEGWNEFDLDAVYASVAPQLSAIHPEFRQQYEQLQAEAADPTHAVHRAWRATDFAVVESWIASRFPVDCETWPEFEARIRDAFDRLATQYAGATRVAVCTSATPIGISTARLFSAPTRQIFELAGSMNNSAFTVLRQRNGNWALSAFNHTPHLPLPYLRTHR